MTTSGVTTTELDRNSIVKAALRKIGAIALGGTPSAEEYTNGAEALNNLVAEFMTLGMPLWARKQYTITMVADQATYTIGDGKAVDTDFPLKILQAWVEPTTGSRQELTQRAQYDFDMLPINSGSSSVPVQFTYKPLINYGELRVWPAPDSTTATDKTLKIVYQAPFDTFVSSTDTPYFPREWNNALIYGLAMLLAPEYGVPLQDRQLLIKEAEAHKEMALDFGIENAPLFFQPEERW